MEVKKSNILIVDDDPHNIHFLEEVLSELENAVIHTTKSGFEAIDICKDKEMAIVLLDLMMPGIDGFGVIEKMRETELNKSTPVIIISGASIDNTDLPSESIEKGAIDFIPKPINTDLLLGKVRHFINIYLQRKELSNLVKQLEYSNLQIRDSQLMLHKITSAAKDVILVINEEGKITYWNDSALQSFGYIKHEIEDKNIQDLLSFDNTTKQFYVFISESLKKKEEINIQGTKEISAVKKNGLKFPAEVSIASFHYSDKFNLVIVLRDITERKKIHNELLKAKELKEANRIMREFMDNVSHELRTPMNAIIGISKMTLKYNSDNLTKKQKEGIELISNSGMRLLDLINDILDLSRLESNKTKVFEESFSIPKMLSSVKSTIISLIDEKAIKFIVRKSNSVPEYILSDFRKITQILLNIIGNSVKFTENGKIELSVHTAENKLFFEITDTGIGMSDEELKVIFQKFRRIERASTKKYKGTGLGLSITKGLVELMGGKISVTSKLGEGTTMSFYLPYKEDIEKNKAESETKLLDEPVQISHNSGNKIIIIEDDQELCYLLENYLRMRNHNVLSFYDGISGLKAIEENKPDLIILDLEIPKITGFDIMKKLDKHSRNEYPILVITGTSYIPNKEKYQYRDIILKPIVETIFIKKVNEILTETIKKNTLLIAEDEDIGIFTIKMMLEKKYNLLFAKNGREVINKYKEHKPDLILMDIMMPEMDGLQSFSEIRKISDVKVIAVTAHANIRDKQKLLNHGFCDYVSKPINEEEIIERIDYHLKK